MAESVEQLSFELTASALAEQERALASLRTCAGTLLGAASIAGSFLAAKASHGSLEAWTILAMIAFALCSACSVWVLLPHDLALAVGGDDLLAVSDDLGVGDVSEAYRTASRWLEPHLHANRRAVAQLATWLTAGCVLLGFEVALWIVSLIG